MFGFGKKKEATRRQDEELLEVLAYLMTPSHIHIDGTDPMEVRAAKVVHASRMVANSAVFNEDGEILFFMVCPCKAAAAIASSTEEEYLILYHLLDTPENTEMFLSQYGMNNLNPDEPIAFVSI